MGVEWVLVFPARAGMIRAVAALLEHDLSIPRESGDDPMLGSVALHGWVYSPRERG